jgi:hypothetical protein
MAEGEIRAMITEMKELMESGKHLGICEDEIGG